jgi:diacylglycerol kinase family enzyme
MTVLVLLNGGSGTMKRDDPVELERRVRDGLRMRGIEAEIRQLAGGEIAEAVRSFVSANTEKVHPTIVVGGGDGTLGSAASVIAGTNVVLGVLPLGTLNHFAKDLGVPTDLDEAMDVIASGRVSTIDVAEVNGRVFINNSSVGVYPFLVAERTAEQKRRGIGKLAAIIPALLRTIRGLSWQRVTLISGGGSPQELRTPCVFVGNNLYDLTALGKRKSLCSGELCVYVVKRQSWLGLVLLPFKVVFGLADAAEDVEVFRLQNLDIKAHRPRMLVSMDGETTESATPLHYRIRPGALQVLVPAVTDAPARQLTAE